MRKDKVRAFEMRREGKSYSYIRTHLNVPKSTLSGWFKGQEWSNQVREKLLEEKRPARMKQIKLMAEANKIRWEKSRREAREEAHGEFVKLKNNPLFLAGIMLYWGEGDKVLKNGKVRLSNSDPNMIRLF